MTAIFDSNTLTGFDTDSFIGNPLSDHQDYDDQITDNLIDESKFRPLGKQEFIAMMLRHRNI